jgi:hypothetical protein
MRSDDVIDIDYTMLGKVLNITVTVNGFGGFGGEAVCDTLLTKAEALQLAESLTASALTLIEYGRSQ